jgi:hypothetical protein
LFPEFVEMLSALSEEKAEYIVVGAYAIGVHLEPRATKDIDIWVRPSKENAARVLRALARFGAPKLGVTATDLATPGLVFQIGVPPRRIDLLTSIDGVEFNEAWDSRVEVAIAGLELPMPILGRETLIANKRASGRPQDVADLAKLEGARKPKKRSRTARKKRGPR